MVTDPIADLLVRIKNASAVGKASVSLPHSRIKLAVAQILAREGYVGEVQTNKKTGELTILLAYRDGRPAIAGGKRLSSPSRRVYMGVRDVHPVKRGKGLLVISTPAGVLTGAEAQKARVGGEALFEVW